jgi:peptide/nickel transport system permease protein
MSIVRRCASVLVSVVFVVSMAAGLIAPASYEKQFREFPNARPSRQFPLGTDELGRDRFSRLLYGSRVSLLLAPTAAAIATLLGVTLGLTAGYAGGWVEAAILRFTDLFASMPGLFLLFTLRAILPLNVSPRVSVCVTFTLLALLGWTSGARVVRAAVVQVKGSGYVLHARAMGCQPLRLLFIHIAASLRPVAATQFWLCVPVFLLAEANLSMLGLGVTEPLPSWGNLLSELQNYRAFLEAPWLLAPAVLLIIVLGSLQFIFADREVGQ